jgi:putative membrane protein
MNVRSFRYLARRAGLVLAALGVASVAMAEPGPSDAQILGIYIQVNSFDIETALLGRAQGHSDSVRKLAEHVATEHLAVRKLAYQLATDCKVTQVLPADRHAAAVNHDKTLAALGPLTGAAFDKAYLKHEVAFHRAAIDAVKTVLLPAAKCAALKEHLTTVLPAFEQHFSHTQMMAKEVGAIN